MIKLARKITNAEHVGSLSCDQLTPRVCACLCHLNVVLIVQKNTSPKKEGQGEFGEGLKKRSVYRPWEWVCYLPVIFPADSAPLMFPPSYPLYLITQLETRASCN